jgi:CheY-like chemotaxis protein
MRVVVAEDVMLTREGIARLLTDVGVEVAAEVGDAASLLGAVQVTRPDAAIVDIRMPPTHTDEGLAVLAYLRSTPLPHCAAPQAKQGLRGLDKYRLPLRASGLARSGRTPPRSARARPGSPCRLPLWSG